MAVGVGQRCVVRIKVTDIELRNARNIKATIKSPQGEEKCLDVSFDEVSGVVYVSVDVNSVGSWAMWLAVRFDKELFYTPAFIFAEVESDAKPCDALYIVDVEVSGESVSVTPPRVDVDAVTREEFEQLSKDVAGKVDKVEGKRLSTNDYTDADKALVQDIPHKLDAGEFYEYKDINDEQILSLSDAIEDVDKNIANKATNNGYYPDMTVGMADNLVGRGDVQEAYINFRPSGGVPGVGNGMNISDGAARINAIKGNSVVHNQLLLNSKFRSTSNWATYNNYTTIASDGEKLTATITSNGAIAVYQSRSKEHVVVNHTYLVIADFEASRATSWGVNMGSTVSEKINSAERKIRTLIVPVTTKTNPFAIYPILSGGEAGDYAYIYSVRLIDLTKEFCGNEPTSYEEYLQRKPMNIANEYAYNEGTFVDMNASSLVSTSDNAFNPKTKKTRVMGGEAYTITADVEFGVYFLADGEDENEEQTIEANSDGTYIFPTNGVCYPDVIMAYDSFHVCLKHSYEKSHFAFQQDKKDFSFIREIVDKDGEPLFPNGMRSAGTAYDEIRYNVTTKKWEAVKRIESIALSSISKSNWKIGSFGTAEKKYEAFSVSYLSLPIKSTNYQAENVITSKYTRANHKIYTEGLDKSFEVNHYYYGAIGIRDYIIIRDTAYTTTDSFWQSLVDDEVMMYYELEEPIVVEIPNSENLNLDYLVWDFGTEEAIATDPSAPFRADINYEPNAVDDIRYANKKIAELEAKISQLLSAQSTNIINE